MSAVETRDYPPARLPIHPVVTNDSFRGGRAAPIASVLDVSKPQTFVSGRYGLARALELSGVGAEDQVLLPAYCCPAMVNPIRWLGAEPVFYKLHDDLSADIDDVATRITPRTKCVLLVHFFGFVQDADPMVALCQDRSLKLVEDCAHAFFGQRDGHSVGSRGDYAFASPMKFFPIYDGGCLVSRHHLPRGPRARRVSPMYQLRAFVDVWDRANDYDRLPASGLRRAMTAGRHAAARLLRGQRGQATVVRRGSPAAMRGGYGFEGKWTGVSMSLTSNLIMRRTSRARLVRLRQANYRLLLDFCSELAGARPLVRELSDDTVPYTFPLYIDDPDSVFPRLKRARVPLLRWDDAELEPCSVSACYSKHLLLVPCHQELTSTDLAWIHRELEGALQPTTSVASRGVNR